MTDTWEVLALQSTGAIGATRGESIQTLWSGYGEIFRVYLQGADIPGLIVKHVAPNHRGTDHPRGWSSDFATARKMRSYQIEQQWYKSWGNQCNDQCRIAGCYTTHNVEEQSWLLLEDLDSSGFPVRNETLDFDSAAVCIDWLAHFHATFLRQRPTGLWSIGTYWHLDTRPDEFNAMPEGKLRENARKIDQILSQCKYQTLVHGDAKVANFCFSRNNKQAAMVDFQYAGGGCGMKDVAYFIGSCLDENQCDLLAPKLLDRYFEVLGVACQPLNINFNELEDEWRRVYPLAWTDFYRFLAGWMPAHKKIHHYTKSMAEQSFRALATL